jgi:hypothetical protein
MGKRIIAFILTILIVSLPAAIYAQSAMSDVVLDETVLEPKDPILATVMALGPGLLLHGCGNYYAENYKMGLFLTSLEVLSIGTMIFGYVQNTQPDMQTIYGGGVEGVRHAGALTFAFGFFLFVGTWLADVAMAGGAADQYNKEHNLEFKSQEESLLNGKTDSTFAAIYNFRF